LLWTRLLPVLLGDVTGFVISPARAMVMGEAFPRHWSLGGPWA
jgi:hypothetical protein